MRALFALRTMVPSGRMESYVPKKVPISQRFFASKKKAARGNHELDKENMQSRTKVRLDAAETFFCFRCDKDKKAKLRFEWPTSQGVKIICNGCHGLLNSRGLKKKK